MQTKKQMEKWYKDMESADIRAKYEAWVKREQEKFDAIHKDNEADNHGT